MCRRIVLTTVGSYGDVHPFIAVALALKARGADVVLATLEEYRGKAEAEGLAFRPIRPSLAQIIERSGLAPEQIVARTMGGSTTFLIDCMIRPYLEQTYEDLLEACRGADLIAASSFSFAAFAAGETLRLPTATLLLSPMLLFSEHDPPVLHEAPWLEVIYRRFGRGGARFVLARMRHGARLFHQVTPKLRRRHSLPRLRTSEVLDRPLEANLVLGLWSPTFAPRPPNTADNVAVAGFTFHDRESGPADTDPALDAFLATGEPPIVFTLGSFAVQAPGDFYEVSAKIARALGQRALLLVGREPERFRSLAGRDVFVAGYAPHSKVFPQARAVVHHGGIGTLAQALRAGVPQLVCPALGDQLDNARRVERRGIGRTLPLRRYAAGAADAALRALLDDADLRARAQVLGARIAAEPDGAEQAAERLLALLGG